MYTYIVTFHDELDGDRILVVAIQAPTHHEAIEIAKNDKETIEWEFSEETTIEARALPATIETPFTVFTFAR